MNIFFSLSDRMYFTKAQPVPIRASVMKSSAPLSLQRGADSAGGRGVKAWMLKKPHLQVCDIIHDGPALDRMALRVDEMEVDLKTPEREQLQRPDALREANSRNNHELTLWKTNEADLVKASAAMSQWILKTLYLRGQGCT